MGSFTNIKQATYTVLVGVVLLFTLASSEDVTVQCPNVDSIFEHGSQIETLVPRRIIHYNCYLGYSLEGDPKQTCGEDGQWIPSQKPRCVKKATCTFQPSILHSTIHVDQANPFMTVGDKATVVCDPGYYTNDYKKTFHVVCSESGEWTMWDGTLLHQCNTKRCPLPPTVPHSVWRYSSFPPQVGLGGEVAEGTRVEYICLEDFVLVDTSQSNLTCMDGQWDGPIPTCVQSMSCPPPANILRGAWKMKSGRELGNVYAVGTEVQYFCQDGYKLFGAQSLECTSFRSWSKVPPLCLPDMEKNWYCPELSKISNGFCKCEGEQNDNLDLCKPYYRNIRVQCACNSGYKLQGNSLLTCTWLSDHEQGSWDHETPYCLREDLADIDPSMEDSDSAGGLHISAESRTHVSTLVIVIATACSVLGVLLLIMVIVVFRRKKPRPRLFHPSVTPPPYSRVHSNSLDEHDRLALMAYADATRVHLPTYEEAVQVGRGGHPGPLPRSVNPLPPGDYRPLPNIPPNLRGTGVVLSGGDNPNRHSTVTTSTINRDGMSENFGSLDTVNVSMSDASTSVTVETFDSGTSTRSITSQCATAGSLRSSEDNLASDNAPLLDSSGENYEDSTQECSTPSLEQKED